MGRNAMRFSRTKARRGSARGFRNHSLLSLANGPFQGSQDTFLRRAPEDPDRQNSKVRAPRKGEGAMKKGPDPNVQPASASTAHQRASIDPFGEIAETWKSAQPPCS